MYGFDRKNNSFGTKPPYKENRHPGGWRWTVTYFKMVESAGIEPASANPLQQVLHT